MCGNKLIAFVGLTCVVIPVFYVLFILLGQKGVTCTHSLLYSGAFHIGGYALGRVCRNYVHQDQHCCTSVKFLFKS